MAVKKFWVFNKPLHFVAEKQNGVYVYCIRDLFVVKKYGMCICVYEVCVPCDPLLV